MCGGFGFLFFWPGGLFFFDYFFGFFYLFNKKAKNKLGIEYIGWFITVLIQDDTTEAVF